MWLCKHNNCMALAGGLLLQCQAATLSKNDAMCDDACVTTSHNTQLAWPTHYEVLTMK
jgi:hypothetical protein